MIRLDALWLCTQPQNMRCGADRLLAVVVNTVGCAQAHHGWLFANARATRRLHRGSVAWISAPAAAPALPLTAQQFEALVVGLPWQRLGIVAAPWSGVNVGSPDTHYVSSASSYEKT